MIMCCQGHGLRPLALAFSRAITNLQTETEIHLGIRKERGLNSSACGYSHVRLFSSERDLQNNGKTDVTIEETSDVKTRHQDCDEQLSAVSKQNCVSNFSTSLPEDEKHLEPALSAMIDEKQLPPVALKTVLVVPGKGPPPEPPVTCCMSGCANCVWIKYAEELRDYYKDGGKSARLALEKIEDPSLRAFVKLELGL